MITDGTAAENRPVEEAALPALLGGRPVRPEGPPAWPLFDREVLEVLQQAHRDGTWGKYHGPWCAALEERLADYHGVALVSLCCSGTFAVELALRGLGIQRGDEVIMAGYDFSGNFQSILAAGARPVLVDLYPATWTLDAAALEEAAGPKVRAVIATHLHGAVVPMRAVCESADRHGWKVVEDAAQMPGAMVQGRRAGTWGDVGVLSFGGSKLLSAGRGGAIVTRQAEVHHRSKLFCNRGNHAFPLSELQAAVLLPQLEKLDVRNARRAENVRYLIEAMQSMAGLRPLVDPRSPRAGGGEGGGGGNETRPGYYKLGFQYDAAALGGLTRERFVQALRAEGIALDAGFRSLAGRSAARCRKVGELPQARAAGERMLVLHHPVLLGVEAELDQITAAVWKVASHAGRM